MTDLVSSARTARECLSQGLGALQSPGVPERLLAVAEPIARAMGALHQIETTGGMAAAQAGPVALDSVRRALAALQEQPIQHPSVDRAMQAVAGSLGIVHGIAQTATVPAPAAAAPPAAGQPYPAQPAFNQVPQAPTAMGPEGFGSTMPSTPSPHQSREPRAQAAVAQTDQQQHPSTLASSQSPAQPPPRGDTWPEASALGQSPPPDSLRIEANLGAHSASNFYKGLSGNDVVDSGGIFVATYRIPPIGTPIWLKVSLPGGYEFEAQATVRWLREATSGSSASAPPGFGAQFTHISPEGRQLVYRYARNREPLFHDDL